MNLHEFQGKELFAKYGLPVSNSKVIYEAEDAHKACRDIGGSKWVVKAQVHAGGRGKAGGVELVDTPEDAISPRRGSAGNRAAGKDACANPALFGYAVQTTPDR